MTSENGKLEDLKTVTKNGGIETNGHSTKSIKKDNLTSTETSTESNKNSDDQNVIPYAKLFRFADSFDYFLIFFGSICGIAHGAGFPVLFVIFGELTTSFTKYGKYLQCDLNYTICFAQGLTNLTQSDWNQETQPELDGFESSAVQFVLYFVYVAIAVFVLATFQTGCWTLQAVRQINRIRAAYFHSILRQNIGFHDATSAGELNARLANDVSKMKNGMAEKVSTTIQHVSSAITGLTVGLVYSWKVSLVTLSVAPLLVASTALLLKITSIFTTKELNAYAKAGSVAEEAFSSIRTVVAFGCQQKEIKRYQESLDGIKKVGVLKGFAFGFSNGFLYLSMYGMYGLSFWYGTKLVIQGEITIGALTTAFFGILIVAFSLGTAGSYSSCFSDSKGAGAKIFAVIDRVPPIDIFSEDGESPFSDNGRIEFKKVDFFYPTRDEVQVLKNVNLTIEHGMTTALVGQSGCGKSTCIQLIQRFYDCTSGEILIGGKDVKSLNVTKHRVQIGVVSQEPVLFATTIAENIRWGRDGVTDDEIHEAAKQANAYDFIMKLPDKFETLVGEGGGQMSGGQKQRIAIARAIVRNPKILLLDEATSALDTESESIVQAALDKASAGRTTVVIAHRLSTIQNADKIVAFQDGVVVEEGSHEELLSNPVGVYSNLVKMQAGREIEEVEEKTSTINDQDLTTGVPGEDSVKRDETRSRLSSNLSRNCDRVSFRSNCKRRSFRETKESAKDKEEDVDEEENLPDVGFMRILRLNKPEWHYIAVGSLFSVAAGAVDPINAILFAEILNTFTISDPVEQARRAALYALLFLAVGGAALLSYIIQSTLFAKSGVELTVRLRRRAFGSILRQDISYFDDHRNSTGALCTRLSTDASRVQGCTGVRLGVVLKSICTLGVALGISFAYGWHLTLLTLAFIPFIALGSFLEFGLLTGQEEVEKDANEQAGQVAGEAMKNIRTVASMTKEKKMHEIYIEKLRAPFKKAKKRSMIIGLGYGYSQCVIYLAYAAVFRLGIELVITRQITFDNVFKVLTAVIFGAMAVGQNSSFAPDFAEAKTSAKRMFALFDKKPNIDAYSDEGLSPAHCKGEVSFGFVSFTYPSRPDVPILKECNISVKPGQTLALVGQSGCGKSTAVQLIERFYDPSSGVVSIDGANICELNVSWLRHQMGLVSQEPVLFDQSIMENIRYGDCQRVTTDEEVVAAAKTANIHNFIQSLPEGYNTLAGAKGGKLSGGQKQRIAIARALLRNPRILLLDEATSALDTESEKLVQEALDVAREGRTCIVVAHRLSTVRNANQIAVMDNGAVAEIGTHDQLIEMGGAYYSLVKAQLSGEEKN